MFEIFFFFLSSMILQDACHGFLPRVQIPLQNMPSASNDQFTWRMPDGSYQFGMQGQDQWRVEKRYPNGAVSVRFAYRTPDGKVHESSFTRGVPPTAALVRGDDIHDVGPDVIEETDYEKFDESSTFKDDLKTKQTSKDLLMSQVKVQEDTIAKGKLPDSQKILQGRILDAHNTLPEIPDAQKTLPEIIPDTQKNQQESTPNVQKILQGRILDAHNTLPEIPDAQKTLPEIIPDTQKNRQESTPNVQKTLQTRILDAQKTLPERIPDAQKTLLESFRVRKPVIKNKYFKKAIPKTSSKGKQGLLDSYFQKQKEAVVSRPKPSYGISYNVRKSQRSVSVKEVPQAIQMEKSLSKKFVNSEPLKGKDRVKKNTEFIKYIRKLDEATKSVFTLF